MKSFSDIKRENNTDLLVETFSHAPEGKEKEATDPETKTDFFDQWAAERTHELQMDGGGVYVLICKDPPYIKVAVGSRTAKIFTNEDRDHLDQAADGEL